MATFDWGEFLKLAKFLAGYAGTEFSQEAALRSGISRAYYAAFGVARRFAQSKGFISLGEAEDHRRLPEHFEYMRRPEIKRTLNKLRQWRNQADYDDELRDLPMMMKVSTDEAQRLLTRLTKP